MVRRAARPSAEREGDRLRKKRNERATPEARARRTRSRRANKGKSQFEAAKVGRREHPAVVQAAPWRPFRLGNGDTLTRYVNDHVAQVAHAGKRRGLVWSPLPLRAAPDGKASQPVSLELQDHGSSLSPENPIVDTTIAKDAAAGISLPDIGITVLPDVDKDSATPDVIGGQAFWGNVATDTDLVVRPVPEGVETFHQLRSEDSPEDLSMRFDLPPGTILRDGGRGAAEIVRGDKVLARVPTPTATDADNAPVPVSSHVAGDALQLHVSHRGNDFAYPIMADPAVVESYSWWDNGTSDFAPWSSGISNEPSGFAYLAGDYWSGRGLYTYNPNNAYFYPAKAPWGDFGQWAFQAPGTAFIYAVQYGAYAHYPSAQYRPYTADECLTFGIWSNTRSAWDGDGSLECGPLARDRTFHGSCVDASCTPAGTPGNYAIFASYIHQPGWRGPFTSYLGAAAVYLSDRDLPTITADSRPAGWDDGASPLEVNVRDTGLGVKRLNASASEAPGFGSSYTSSCSGNRSYRCPNDFRGSYPLTSLPEGENTVRADAEDIVGNASTESWAVKIDRSDPTLNVSGSLRAGAGTELPAGQYTLNIAATDGRTDQGAAGRRSGVASVETTLDGDDLDSADQECPQGSCPLNRSLTVNTGDFARGSHRVTTIVTDHVGRQTRESFEFSTERCCFDPPASWGSALLHGEPMFGDVTGDGLADAVARNTLTGQWSVARSTGSSFSEFAAWGALPDMTAAEDRAIGDVDGDGQADLVGRNRTTGQVLLAKSNGTSFEATTVAGNWPASREFALANVDGGEDGTVDIVGRDSADGLVYASFGWSGAVDRGVAVTSYGVPAGEVAAVTDVTGDTSADLIVRSGASISVAAFDVEEGSFESPQQWGSVASGHALLTGDADGNMVTDILSVDPTNGDVYLAASEGRSLQPSKKIGAFPLGYRLSAAELSGDARSDLVGYSTLTSDLRVAVMSELSGPVDPSESWVPDSDLDYGDPTRLGIGAGEDEAEGDVDPPATAARRKPANAMKLGMSDERLLERGDLRDLSTGQPIERQSALAMTPPPHESSAADKAVGRILDRMKQAGATIVRQNVYWGWTENRKVGPAGAYPTEGRYKWDQIRRLVKMIKRRGMRPYLTITGIADQGLDCNENFNLNGIACGPTPVRTGVNPPPTAFREFAQAVAAQFTSPEYRVVEYGVWNEPNNPTTFLTAGPNPRTSTHNLYRELYSSAYVGINAAQPQNRVFLGHLSARRTPLGSTGTYLCNVVAAAPGTLRTDAVVWHPYQHQRPPTQKSPNGQVGIGNTSDIQKLMSRLAKNGAVRSGKKCKTDMDSSRKLRLPPKASGGVPPLVFGEFGYLNLPFNDASRLRDPNSFHTEAKRATLFSSALKYARAQGAAWTVVFHGTEKFEGPPNSARADYGLFSVTGEVLGKRSYGKGPGTAASPYANFQDRAAYCRIRAWAISARLLTKPVPCGDL